MHGTGELPWYSLAVLVTLLVLLVIIIKIVSSYNENKAQYIP